MIPILEGNTPDTKNTEVAVKKNKNKLFCFSSISYSMKGRRAPTGQPQ